LNPRVNRDFAPMHLIRSLKINPGLYDFAETEYKRLTKYMYHGNDVGQVRRIINYHIPQHSAVSEDANDTCGGVNNFLYSCRNLHSVPLPLRFWLSSRLRNRVMDEEREKAVLEFKMLVF